MHKYCGWVEDCHPRLPLPKQTGHNPMLNTHQERSVERALEDFRGRGKFFEGCRLSGMLHQKKKGKEKRKCNKEEGHIQWILGRQKSYDAWPFSQAVCNCLFTRKKEGKALVRYKNLVK